MRSRLKARHLNATADSIHPGVTGIKTIHSLLSQHGSNQIDNDGNRARRIEPHDLLLPLVYLPSSIPMFLHHHESWGTFSSPSTFKNILLHTCTLVYVLTRGNPCREGRGRGEADVHRCSHSDHLRKLATNHQQRLDTSAGEGRLRHTRH